MPDISVLEIGFTVIVALCVLAVIFVVRSTSERKYKGGQRLREVSGDSQIGMAALTPPPTGTRDRIDNWFDLAVQRSGLEASPTGVIAVMLLMAILLGSALYFWKGGLGISSLGIVVGIGIPLAIVAFYNRRYRWRLQDQLPDAYRMLAGSVRAGQTLEQAIEFYAERGGKPLADEFAHTAGLMRLGVGPTAALQSTATRVRLLDFDLLVSTVGLYTQTGGNLVLLLERLADSVRDRNQFHGQFFAATAQSRVVAIAIGIAAPLMLLVYVLAEPEHVQSFLESTTGWALLGVCALLEVIGVIWLWRILRVDY